MGETQYYSHVRKWLEQKGFYCGGGMVYAGTNRDRFYENIGTKAMRVDVTGVRNVGSTYGDSLEVVCVEVKDSSSITFAHIAQAFGYSLVANRVYLAHTANLDAYWDRFLRRIGLGFLSINASTNKVTEMIQSSLFHPDESSYLEFLQALWILKCTICGVYTFRWDTIDGIEGKSFLRLKRSAQISRMKDKDDHPFNPQIPRSDYIRRYICRHCLNDLFFEEGSDSLIEKGFSWSNYEDEDE